jgi:hypothetical protein
MLKKAVKTSGHSVALATMADVRRDANARRLMAEALGRPATRETATDGAPVRGVILVGDATLVGDVTLVGNVILPAEREQAPDAAQVP